MFANTVQPSVLSLFSSTGSAPLQLFEVCMDQDPEMRADSVVCFVKDNEPVGASMRFHRATSLASTGQLVEKDEEVKLVEPAPLYDIEDEDDEDVVQGNGEYGYDGGRGVGIGSEAGDREARHRRTRRRRMGRELDQTVLHLQSPTIRTTYIRCPPAGPSSLQNASTHERERGMELGITLPWIHIQVRPLGPGIRSGRDAWAVDVGVADRAGNRGVIRASTFQKEASLKPAHDPPLLHIPLRFPTRSSSLPSTAVAAPALTSWATIDLDLPATMRYFGILAQRMQAARHSERLALEQDQDQDQGHGTYGYKPDQGIQSRLPIPRDVFACVTYVKVYANCRLRRIWFSENRQSTNLPWEFELYAAGQ